MLPNSPWSAHSQPIWAGPIPNRILIIDDDQGLARLVALLLRHSGYETEVANSGDDGLTLLSQNIYEAVVLDMRMPGKDGRTVYKEMRQKGIETPVLVLSAYGARSAYIDLNAQGYLDKPFEPDTLVDAVAAMLSQSRTTQTS